MKKGNGGSNSKMKNRIIFCCKKCGQCCKDIRGYVYVTNKGLEAMAVKIGVNEKLFRKKYMVIAGKLKPHLKFKKNGSCIFLRYNKCSINSVKPKQCKTYPFWFEYFRNSKKFSKLKRECIGVQIKAGKK